MTGPIETEAQARQLPAVRAIWDAVHAATRRGVMAELSHQLIEEALTAAGVQLGAYDHRILIWLSGFEPTTAGVVASWITRAAAASTHPVTPDGPRSPLQGQTSLDRTPVRSNQP